ncbi:tRNA (guanosine(46)-N(7))-methyltransferase TrmB [Oceanicoccus sp. KOV_DT_Chl]|uniref:tRNA (guanine(46)-N(7))-methyltransferase TrmB n=1 Tax=Oceanicoccus sp. KOV_DT_Chl TaxID=1904639 RepID=UPI001F3A22D3|nr:methyltransferase domain-containing protein [Oceanicoccus sp. KOV_DT_Chl]
MNNSRIISSNQQGVHDKLDTIVRRHLKSPFRRPFPDYSLRAFEQAQQVVAQHRGPLILDSFCGVGESTINIAKTHPEALVIGIDKSSHRLDKHRQHFPNNDVQNYYLLQADIDDFWRLAVADGWRLQQHFLLYPNPWPKAAQLKRRVHGSPLFPALIQLGGKIELRSNWPIYVEEFAQALSIAGFKATAHVYTPARSITPFERKYSESGQKLWYCQCQLD